MPFKIAELYTEVRASTLTFNAQMMGVKKTLDVISVKMASVSALAKKMLFGATIGVAGLAKVAISYQKNMAMVSTMLSGESMKWMEEYKVGIKSLSREFGQGTAALSKGMYDLLSASIDPAKAMDVLRIATESAVGGFTDSAVAVDGLTSLMNAYGAAAEDAGKVSDIMFATVKRGKTTFSELAGVIGKMAPTSRAAGVSMEQMSAMFATMTRQGLSAHDAAQKIVSLMRIMAKEGMTLEGILTRFKGKTLEDIIKAGIEARAAAAIVTLTGDIKGFRTDMEVMMDSAGLRMEAFGKAAETASFRWAKMKETFLATAETLGNILLPSLEKLMASTTNILKKWEEWIEKNKELLGKIIIIMGVLVVFAAVLPTLTTLLGILITTLSVVTTVIGAILSPIGLLIAAIIVLAATITAAIIPGETWGKKIQWLKGVMNDFIGWAEPIWDKFLKDMTYAFRVAEFAIVNWKLTTKLVISTIIYDFSRLYNELKYFLIDWIPYALSWMSKNWLDSFIALAKYTGKFLKNVWENFKSWSEKGWDYIVSGFDPEKWTWHWEGLGEKAKKELEGIFEDFKPPERKEGTLEEYYKNEMIKAQAEVDEGLKEIWKKIMNPDIPAGDFTNIWGNQLKKLGEDFWLSEEEFNKKYNKEPIIPDIEEEAKKEFQMTFIGLEELSKKIQVSIGKEEKDYAKLQLEEAEEQTVVLLDINKNIKGMPDRDRAILT